MKPGSRAVKVGLPGDRVCSPISKDRACFPWYRFAGVILTEVTMSNLKKIIQDIDQQINMLMMLRKSFDDIILAGGVMDSPKIADAVNMLQIMELDWGKILDDVCRLS